MITDSTTDGWIEEFIKRKWTSGLFWAVGAAAEKKNLLTAISMQLFGVVFSTFCGQKKILKIFFAHNKLKKPPQKVAYLWQLEFFLLCSPACPKQPRSSFPFYKLFHATISGRISARNHKRIILSHLALKETYLELNRGHVICLCWALSEGFHK